MSSVSSAARTSIQMMAGLSGSPRESSATREQLVAPMESASTAVAAMPAASTASRTARIKDCHQCSGSCVAQPGRGCRVGSEAIEKPSIEPWESITAARTPPVPTSTPST